MTSDADPHETATAMLGAWQAAFNRRDIDALTGLYSDNATLFGGKAELSSGRDGVRAYFNQVNPTLRAAMAEQAATQIAPGVVLSAGFVDFSAGDVRLPFRLTMVFVWSDDRWLIAQHHASPRAAVTQTSTT